MFYAAFDPLVVGFDSRADRDSWLKDIGRYGFTPVSAAQARQVSTPEQRRKERLGYCLASVHYQKSNGVWRKAF